VQAGWISVRAAGYRLQAIACSRPVLGLLLIGSWLQAGWISVRAAGNK